MDEDLENLLDDDYLKEFMERRMREMMVAKQPTKRFGILIDLSGGEAFLDAIDKEDKAVTVVVFIYEDGTAGCEPMHKALQTVVKDYPGTKGWRGLRSLIRKVDSKSIFSFLCTNSNVQGGPSRFYNGNRSIMCCLIDPPPILNNPSLTA